MNATAAVGRRRVRGIALVCLVGCGAVWADDDAPQAWAWSAAVAQWSAGLRGRIEPDAGTPSLKAHFSDFVDHFEAGIAVSLEARRGRWAFLLEPFYVDFDRAMPTPNRWVQVDVSQIQYGLAGAYRFGVTRTASFDAVLGARYNELDVVLSAPGSPKESAFRSWVDPFVGVRMKVKPGARWTWWLRGDVGGFNVGSRRTWSAASQLGYRIGRPTSLVFGYGVIATDYRAALGAHRLRYDTRIGGPSLGVTLQL